MLLGKITGKVTTRQFTFDVTSETKNLEYIKVYHPAYEYVLCQVVELAKSSAGTMATCNVIGYRDKGRVKPLRIPFDPGSEVMLADDDFIQEVIALPDESAGAYMGKIEGRDIPIYLDVQRMLTKHVSVLAKSGAGKSYAVGVLLEEILEHGVPVIVIDPHGEHNTLKTPASPDDEEKQRMARFAIEAKGYEVREFGNPTVTGANPLQLSNKLTRQELVHMLPKLNSTQQGLLYQAIRNSEHTDFDQLLLALEAEDSMAKWALINLVEGLRNHNIFSSEPLTPNDLVSPGKAAIINLKGYPPEIQEIIVYKLANDLFTLRKENKIAPFFLVVEEAHNFCPERSFGESSSSKILRTIASEGRKFGLGMCVISQRPARVDKSVLSQCTTQIVLKVTNPNDLKAVSNSVEGLTSETEKEIKNLAVGTALVTGVVDLPLIVSVRPRRSQHGGIAVNILDPRTVQANEDTELLPVFLPNVTPRDIKLMHEDPVSVQTILRPATRFMCEERGETFPIVVDRTRNEIVLNHETTKKLPQLQSLSKKERDVLSHLFKHKRINPSELGISLGLIQKLLAAGYLTMASKETYKLSSVYHFAKLKSASMPAPIKYERVAADKKLAARYTPTEAQAQLARFATIKDSQDCYVVEYLAKKI